MQRKKGVKAELERYVANDNYIAIGIIIFFLLFLLFFFQVRKGSDGFQKCFQIDEQNLVDVEEERESGIQKNEQKKKNVTKMEGWERFPTKCSQEKSLG